MQHITKLIIIIAFALLLGFRKHGKGGGESSKVETETPSECQKLIDEVQAPVVIAENTVVFLLLSQLEYDLQPMRIQRELDDVIDDFVTYSDRAGKKFTKYGIKDVSTISKNLVFRYADGREEKLYFNTYEGCVAIALFRKGKKSKMIYESMQDYGMLKAISEYFEIDIKENN